MDAKNLVIATDLDGTLFYPKKKIKMFTKKNRSFIRRFIDSGGRLVIVSGRNRFFGKKVINKLKRPADVIGCNSAFIIADGKTIYEAKLENEKICKILPDISKEFKPAGIFAMTRDYNFILPTRRFNLFYRIAYKFYEIGQGTYLEPSTKSDKILHKELNDGALYKVMLFFGVTKKAIARSLAAYNILVKKYPEFEFCWCKELIEINAKGCTKGFGLKTYLDYLKIKHDNIMVVGDSGNDISMFDEFPQSFCMSHAPKLVSDHANHIVDSVSDLEQYINEREESNL